MTTPTRAALALATISALTLSLAACGEAGKEEAEGGATLVKKGTLVAAMSGEFQPFSYREGNTLTGFDYDIAAAVAEEMGLKLEAQTGAFDTLIGGLKANRYDVLIASMTPTEERAKQVDFTEGYYSSGAQAFVAAGTECTDLSAMDKPSIGVAAGTTYLDYLNKEGKDWVGEVRTFSSDITALQDVGTGRLDAAMTDRLVGLYQIQKAGLKLEPCGDPLFVESPAFAVKKGNSGLEKDLDEALAAIKADGTYGKISQKYFGQDISQTAGDDASSTSR